MSTAREGGLCIPGLSLRFSLSTDIHPAGHRRGCFVLPANPPPGGGGSEGLIFPAMPALGARGMLPTRRSGAELSRSPLFANPVNTNTPVLFENDGRAPLTLSGPVALTDTIRGDQGRAGS